MIFSTDSGLIATLRKKAYEWANAVRELNTTNVPASLLAEKNALLNSARTIKNTIEGVLGTVDELHTGLGAIPIVIPAIAIAGASAAIYKWYSDFETLKQKLAHHNSLVQSGASPAAAAAALNNALNGAPMTISTKMVLGGVAVAGLYLFFKRGR